MSTADQDRTRGGAAFYALPLTGQADQLDIECIAADPCHPGLRTHRYRALPGHGRRRVFDSYVETGADAWRIYWMWGPTGPDRPVTDPETASVLTVLLIGPHL
ncbi:hypothetical protein ABZW10_38195 [Kitasatospora sp. NPDC004723]|uniref:hypothetical protein n=1 Tax=Kitasatospora sp. NPDC004723 TaxID=3154288 RepID=UPI0033BA7A8A